MLWAILILGCNVNDDDRSTSIISIDNLSSQRGTNDAAETLTRHQHIDTLRIKGELYKSSLAFIPATLEVDTLSLQTPRFKLENLRNSVFARSIRSLYLSKVIVDTEQSVELLYLPSITLMIFSDCSFDTGAMHSLSRLDGIRHVRFFFCGPSESQLAILAEHGRLESLHLEGAQYTDASVESLASMQTLTHLSLLDTSITEKALTDLRLARPGLSLDVSVPIANESTNADR